MTNVVVALAGMALLGACTTESQGAPRPVSQPPTSNSSGGEPSGDGDRPGDKAPDVSEPLDITRFLRDPCLALTAAQAGDLSMSTQGTPGEMPLGKTCTWQNPDTSARIDLGMRDKNPGGLSNLYAANEAGEYEFFDELDPVEGFPAVAYGETDARRDGACFVSVGVSNDLSFATTVRLSPENVGTQDPCGTAAMVAGLMVRTMRG